MREDEGEPYILEGADGELWRGMNGAMNSASRR